MKTSNPPEVDLQLRHSTQRQKNSSRKNVALLAGLWCLAAGFGGVAKGAVTADFTNGNSATLPDGYVGVAGGGWVGPWTPKVSGCTFNNTVTNSSPLGGGGNYLKALLTAGTASQGYPGAFGRKFDSAIVSTTAPHTVSCKILLDSAMTIQSDALLVFGDVGTGYSTSTGPGNTWLISGYYNSGNPVWSFFDGNRAGTSTRVLTTMPLVVGTVYTMTVQVDPVAKTWTLAIDNGTTQFQSGPLGFRNAAASGSGNTLTFGANVRNTTGTLGYSLDTLSVTTSQSDADADGMPDAWETANGLNPNSAADAALDPDADGLTNLQEYTYSTNPHGFDSAGTVTITPDIANAYEKEGTLARLKITRAGGAVPATVNFALSGIATKPGLSGADYQVEDINGVAISGSVSLAFQSNTAYVVIRPLLDTTNEYPETVTATLSANARYTVGAANAASVTVGDASDIPANTQVFVANLTPPTGVNSGASGTGVLVLNGPKTSAKISLTFNGLSSGQTNAYIRYGVPEGVGPELRPNLGVGQLTDVVWDIVPVGPYSGQQIIDALFQVGGHYTYTNLGTANYPAGEISGTWALSNGSSVFTPPAPPPAITSLTGDNLKRDVARFLAQTTFGATQADIDALTTSVTTTYGGDRINAFNAWIDTQLGYVQTTLYDHVKASNQREWAARGIDPYTATSSFPSNENLRYAWWTVSTKARDQLRQRVAFALSEIFVVSNLYGEVPKNAWQYAIANHYDMLGGYATGNFRSLLESVSKHPMMGQYLSHLKNQKAIVDGNGNILVSPDENFAREIMQLFSIGLMQLQPDGSLKLSGGAPLQTYDNMDIQNLARVFTGWSFSKASGPKASGYPLIDNTNFFLPGDQGYGPRFFQYNWVYPMKNFGPTYHDTGAKTVLGSNIPAGLDGEADLDAALDIIGNHPNVGPFISRLLIQRLVTSNPSRGYVYRVAQKFNNDGSGARGDMKAVLKAILLDYEARDLSVAALNSFGKQKEPIVAYVQLQRAFNAKSGMLVSDLNAFGYPAAQYANFPANATLFRSHITTEPPGLGQTPFQSPTVFNWFLPDYNPGGALGAAGLVAPEMRINSESQVFGQYNYSYTFIQSANGGVVGGEQLYGVTDNTLDNINASLTEVAAVYDAAIASGKTVTEATTITLDYLDMLLNGGDMKARYATASEPNPRSILINAYSGLTFTTTLTRVSMLIHLLVDSPEYNHQK